METNFKNLTTEELKALRQNIVLELEKREEQHKDWNTLTDAIKRYVKKWGDIEYLVTDNPDDDILINEQVIYPEPGKMRPRYD